MKFCCIKSLWVIGLVPMEQCIECIIWIYCYCQIVYFLKEKTFQDLENAQNVWKELLQNFQISCFWIFRGN